LRTTPEFREWDRERVREARARFDCLFCGAKPGECCTTRRLGTPNLHTVHSARWGAEIARSGYFEGEI
jgi:hypothetical protein